MNRYRACNLYFTILTFILLLTSPFTAYSREDTLKYTQTPSMASDLSPQEVLEKLKAGNKRFLSGDMHYRNYTKQAFITAEKGQAPYAVVLSCMDSRGPVEIVLDQGIGDIFSLRVAGNILNQDMIGSMEFATKVLGSKVIVIMGHTQCGAVAAACKSTEFTNLSGVFDKIKPSVKMVVGSATPDCSPENVDKIARQNVINMINHLRNHSRIIDELVKNKNVLIVGAMHNLSTGEVVFF